MLEKIATRLLKLRKHFGKSQKEMAQWVDISQLAWFNYEAGKSLPNGKVLAKLCKYGVNINWVLAGYGEMLNYLNFSPTENKPNNEEVLLTNTIEHVEEWLNANKKSISPHKKAELLTHIYTDTLESGSNEVNNNKANSLLKMVAE